MAKMNSKKIAKVAIMGTSVIIGTPILVGLVGGFIPELMIPLLNVNIATVGAAGLVAGVTEYALENIKQLN